MIDDKLLNETFAALANPTRRAILARLMLQPATVNELAKPFDMSLPAVSGHIRVLEKAGLITKGKEAQSRPCSINAEPLKAVASWAQQYRPIWEARFDRMDSYLKQSQGENNDG